ncbi:YgcG family protein [Paracoccus sp. (in: a-proteobacteria)]|uniref:TPM domain-containing protein n=1 Tax=Paracoccus sp. TaxID=267 RepID=UPI0026E0461D|nr:TPM domain-containing protein [Paracoccus sp. (in: a-proteobacteria)]MDO5647226.1 TPM domain-containing protein [Paracoccus sp. (in: a-proteobacteria)]
MIRAAVIWLMLALPVAAQDLPDWVHTSINDFAAVLTNDDTRVLDQALIALYRDTGVQGTVVTLPSRAEWGGTLEQFATRLFNHWGVGDATRNDGFMVLVLPDDREARIELGAGYSRNADLVAERIMNRTMLPAFRDGNMSGGTRDGALQVIDLIARPVAAGHGVEPPRRGIGDWGPMVLFWGVFAFIASTIARGIWRDVQRRRQPCPNCQGRGLTEETAPIENATDAAGRPLRESVWRRCPTCGWTSPRTDRDTRPRSGGGRSGGFGGGQSSGGGASGRW